MALCFQLLGCLHVIMPEVLKLYYNMASKLQPPFS